MAILMGIFSFQANTSTEHRSAEFEEGEEVYLCSPSVPSWYVLGWTLYQCGILKAVTSGCQQSYVVSGLVSSCLIIRHYVTSWV